MKFKDHEDKIRNINIESTINNIFARSTALKEFYSCLVPDSNKVLSKREAQEVLNTLVCLHQPIEVGIASLVKDLLESKILDEHIRNYLGIRFIPHPNPLSEEDIRRAIEHASRIEEVKVKLPFSTEPLHVV